METGNLSESVLWDLDESQLTSLRLLWLALETGGGSFPSPLARASNSSVSCCQGCQDVTSGRWASDQWTPSLGKDVGPGQDGGVLANGWAWEP